MVRAINCGLVLAIWSVQAIAFAQPSQDQIALGPDRQVYRKIVSRAVQYLEVKGQADDGAFSKHAGVGVTAMVTTALLRHGRSADSPAVARALHYLRQFVQDDGGIYQPGTFYRNYETCLAIMCFKAADRDGRYSTILKRADAFVRNQQWDEGESIDQSNVAYGGAGYGKHKRPDLSNTSFLIDALKTMDGPDDKQAIERALTFVSRCQNLESEHNTTAFSAKNPDGGFYYTPAAGGTSQAGLTEAGGLRSYGSMTYAGLKSMVYAGLTPDDPRVKAAIGWIKKNYTLEANPGLGNAGLFYYYHVFAKSLDAMGWATIVDTHGQKHYWRAELVQALSRLQRPDGAWVNPTDRWLEGDPNLVTAYALLALSYCKPPRHGRSAKP